MLNYEKSQKIFYFFFYTNNPGSFTAVSAVSAVSGRNLRKVFENYSIAIYQSRTFIHSSSPLTTLA